MEQFADLFLVVGIVFGVMSVPAIFRSVMDGEPPRLAALTMIASCALIVVAIRETPNFSVYDIPDSFVRVIGSFRR